MEQPKTRMDRFRDWWEKKQLHFRRRQSIWYFLWMIEIVLFYSLLIGLNFFISTDPVYHTIKEGQLLQFHDVQYELVSYEMDPKTGQLLLKLGNPSLEVASFETRKWHVSVEYQNGQKDRSTVKTFSGENDYTVLAISHLSKEWDALRVTLSFTQAGESTEQKLVFSKDDLNPEKVHIPTQQMVEKEAIQYSIHQREKAILQCEKAIEKSQQSVTELTQTIDKLSKDLPYQTEKQQMETNGQMEQLEGTIREYINQQEEQQRQKEEYQQQIEKLKEKEKSLEK
ncbi:hypothetical protein [Enterococcus sp. 5B3_DIV0040]|uniref:hypothetical protein n=1 Tax=Enterococcus sp. 5B3_DIV0040 TaxID=1834182 RepID=UPI000A331707|nr:hypothetical protein [Enterococcus sp. 5B3_DIV0040]OTO03240.1 hypothetical protein A5883_000205 [Enterococcus sp. 5B3_DIV0040]